MQIKTKIVFGIDRFCVLRGSNAGMYLCRMFKKLVGNV